MRKIILSCMILFCGKAFSQQLAPLTVEKIMRDPKWIGSSPSNIFWSPDGQKLYFNWNPEQSLDENESIYVGGGAGISPSDSLYYITLKNTVPQKVPTEDRSLIEAEKDGSWNSSKTKLLYTKDNGLYLLDVASGKLNMLIQTSDEIRNPVFAFNDTKIVYQQNNNLFSRDVATGQTLQLTNFKSSNETAPSQFSGMAGRRQAGFANGRQNNLSSQDEFLQSDALANSIVLQEEKKKRDLREKTNRTQLKNSFPKAINIGDKILSGLEASPDGRYVTYNLIERPKGVKRTEVPNYVTQSGYIENIPGRTNVGAPGYSSESYIFDCQKNTFYPIKTEQIPGIHDLPAYLKDYPKKDSILAKEPPMRKVSILSPVWNADGSKAFVVIMSADHKDRWIMLLDAATAKLTLIDRQHDDAWIGGPGIGYGGNVGWIDENTMWYQSEESGYSHIYTANVVSEKKKALTSGKYEVQSAELSPDKKYFYIVTNEIEPGQTQFYQLDIQSGKQTRITNKTGGNVVTISPDGKNIAFLYSTSVHPWELYLQQNKPGTKAVQITNKAESAEYKSYNWREPDIITFKDKDGFDVYADVYKPEHPAPSHPGVIFVHGAGYLQDVEKWWSYYFREHMFMNLLVDEGYTVMDIDYRGSAGYGSKWRTAIYRHMGGSDLDDIVDGADYMVNTLGVDKSKIGIWGGSYGGFMTLMAMFKTKAFVCGAALRSVTDWAHYNDGYTSEILNNPQDDSLAYVRSSPIYFANGLDGYLLMCHGMVDTNVHFQDIVRLNQKLIELGKKNWKLAVYPVESHDFKQPSSWTDEYSRIYQLFQSHLK
ncbi:hypothetical protein A9P82_05120 [Arachidicoccus ginsenosidimutans]|uniref:S9 family peptidase n=1 Tax=Arachidicoccus sp. BS20 TaxID=1850526 RepID=UPI0007F15C85|nr:prolyl oligopeptidase family serine peptidase [Arachidicoccus sp. BS20]ANI88717.1 hypothetical protein A9P82_05120 [Arachidicoccus sp. BS20]